MRFNYGLEKKKFDARWRKLYEEYIQAGWDEESIQLMYEFDYEEFKRERVFCAHNQYLDEIIRDGDGLEDTRLSNIFGEISSYSTEMPTNPDQSRYGWLEEIEDRELYNILNSLPEDSLELITQLAIDELRQVDIAIQVGVTRAAIAKKVRKLREKLEILRKRG